MLYIVQTTKSPEQAGATLEAAVKRYQFGVLAVHDLQASMAKHGLTFPKSCRIYEVYQPKQAKQALDANRPLPRPCPVGSRSIPRGIRPPSMIRPTTLPGLFNEPGLPSVACEIERELVAIMDEASESR